MSATAQIAGPATGQIAREFIDEPRDKSLERVARAVVVSADREAFTDADSSEPQTASGVRGNPLAAISTRTVAILREHYGRGPTQAKTYALDDILLVVSRGRGYTPLERTIMANGGAERVIAMRHDFQRMVAERYRQAVRALTGREVLAVLSQVHVEPDVTVEIFLMDRPLDDIASSKPPTPALSLSVADSG